MSLFDATLRGGRAWTTVASGYAVTKKPRGIAKSDLAAVPFAAMDAIPQGGAYAATFTLKAPREVGSGTYFERGDVLVARITPSFENGKQALTRNLPTLFGYATTEVIPLHPLNGGNDPRLLFFYLLHPDVRAYVAERMEGSTGRQRVPAEVLLGLPMPAIDFPEQAPMANALEVVHRALDAEHKSEEAVKALKRSVMRALFTRGLRGEAQKETEIGQLPQSWDLTTLGNMCGAGNGVIQTGPFGSQLHAHEYELGGVPVINPTHLAGNAIDHRDVPRVPDVVAGRLARHRVQTGDILFGRRGEIGRHGLVSQAEAGWLCGTGCFLVRLDHPELDNGFVSTFLSTDTVVSWLSSHAAGTIMPNLNGAILGRLPIAYPDLDEQGEIVAILDAIDRKIDLHRRKRAVLDDLFKALLHKLMTGEIRVADIDLSSIERHGETQ